MSFVGRGGGHRGRHMMGPVVRAKNTKYTLIRLSSYLLEQKATLVLVFFLVALTTGFNLCGPYFVGIAVDDYLVPQKINGLTNIILLLTAVYISASFSSWLQNYIMIGVSQKSIKKIREDLFIKIQSLSLRFFDQRPHGEIMSRFTNDIENISNALTQSVTQFLTSILTIIGIVIVMLSINVILALSTLLTIPLVLILTKNLAKFTRKAYSERQKKLGALNGLIEETITGQKIIKLYSHEPQTIDRFTKGNDSLKTAAIHAETLAGSMGPIMNLINRLGFAIVVGIGGWLTVKDMATVGVIATFVTYARHFSRPLSQIAALYNTIQSALAGAERVFEVIDENPDIKNPPDAFLVSKFKGEVSFEDVNFAYNDDTLVLKNINLQVQTGQTIALVGPTGSGKTTIINLLTRFYDVKSGSIKIDGIDIRKMKKENLREKLGIVLQDTYLFSGTIKENIRYGNLNASDDQIIEAAKTANAHQFIHRLPQGYDTVLTEEGSNLSQGQRQLLSIARVVLSNPDILILDEATSSVDTRTEILIQRAMLNLMKNRTAFIIAHRLKTIKNADIILVINNGEIIERGNHQTLLQAKGFYYNLYSSQFQKLSPSS